MWTVWLLILLTEWEHACIHMLEILAREVDNMAYSNSLTEDKSDQMYRFVVKNLMYFAICPDIVQLLS